MAVRVAINGFGRIGRSFFRLAFEDPNIEIVAINGRSANKVFAHLLKYDSTFGIYNHDVSFDDENLIVDGKKVKILSVKEPGLMPWKELAVDIVLESTGAFNSMEKAAPHLDAGAKKVVLSAPAKGEMPTFVYGVNHLDYQPDKHHVVSNASCTTNGLAPVAKVIDDNFGLVKGLMTTVHAYTNDQNILDKSHKDLRRARTAGVSIVPTTTGAAKAVALVLPHLKGKLNGFAMRIPTPDVSIIDLNVELSRAVTAEEVNAVLKKAAEGEMKGIIGYSEEPLVSIDYLGNSHSGIIDALSTMVVGDNLVKIIIWYDNEWGYSNRVKDLITYMGERI